MRNNIAIKSNKKVTYTPLDLFPDESSNKESIKLVEKIRD